MYFLMYLLHLFYNCTFQIVKEPHVLCLGNVFPSVSPLLPSISLSLYLTGRNWPGLNRMCCSCSGSTTTTVANNVALSPPDAGRIPNTEAQVEQDGVAALHRILCAESFAEKERRLSEMILQLQLLRERLVQQQDQSKVGSPLAHRHIKRNSQIIPANIVV